VKESIHAICRGPEDHKECPSIRVLKHGRSSGWTAGSLNEIASDCSRDGGNSSTRELCIINICKNKDAKLPHFSKKGDSGSLVIDLSGRPVGMMHGGNQLEDWFMAEITYATPIEWLLDDIKQQLDLQDADIEF